MGHTSEKSNAIKDFWKKKKHSVKLGLVTLSTLNAIACAIPNTINATGPKESTTTSSTSNPLEGYVVTVGTPTPVATVSPTEVLQEKETVDTVMSKYLARKPITILNLDSSEYEKIAKKLRDNYSDETNYVRFSLNDADAQTIVNFMNKLLDALEKTPSDKLFPRIRLEVTGGSQAVFDAIAKLLENKETNKKIILQTGDEIIEFAIGSKIIGQIRSGRTFYYNATTSLDRIPKEALNDITVGGKMLASTAVDTKLLFGFQEEEMGNGKIDQIGFVLFPSDLKEIDLPNGYKNTATIGLIKNGVKTSASAMQKTVSSEVVFTDLKTDRDGKLTECKLTSKMEGNDVFEKQDVEVLVKIGDKTILVPVFHQNKKDFNNDTIFNYSYFDQEGDSKGGGYVREPVTRKK